MRQAACTAVHASRSPSGVCAFCNSRPGNCRFNSALTSPAIRAGGFPLVTEGTPLRQLPISPSNDGGRIDVYEFSREVWVSCSHVIHPGNDLRHAWNVSDRMRRRRVECRVVTALDRVFGVRMGVWKAKEAASENSETASNLLLSVGLTGFEPATP